MKILSYSRRQDAPSNLTQMRYLIDGIKNGKVGNTSTKNLGFIVFWSKYPIALEKVIDEIPVPFYILNTITGHGKLHEPVVPSVDEQIDLFIRLSKRLGKDRMVWRFDPVIIDDVMTTEKQLEQFTYIYGKLRGYTNKVVFSFVETRYLEDGEGCNGYHYRKSTDWEQREFMVGAHIICKDMEICSCETFTGLPDIHENRCIDNERISRIVGYEVPYQKDPAQTRRGCNCTKSTDVGSYKNKCGFHCGYCYTDYFAEKFQYVKV